MKKILIVTYYFYPENTPRAFRAFELAKEFSNEGNEITVIIPKNNYDYTEFEKKYNIKIFSIPSGFLLNKSKNTSDYKILKNKSHKSIVVQLFKSLLSKLIKPLYFDGKITEYIIPLYTFLSSLTCRYDKVISIGLPFSVHLGVALSRKNNDLAKCYIADYGDPFSFNSTQRPPFYLKKLEKHILKQFDFITVPIENAKKAFLPLVSDAKIHIIPQGFDFSHIQRLEYYEHHIPTFIYAGNFYEKIRNPKKLLDFLLTYNKPFKFYIYTDMSMKENQICLQFYIDRLKDKVFIKPLIERIECIKLLSSYDFLININNVSSIQSPSKLIDYKLAMRPIFSFSQNEFNKDRFMEFLNKQYPKLDNDINLDDYDIKTVANKFLNLLK